MYFRNSPSFQNFRSSDRSAVVSETVSGNCILETPGNFWEQPQAIFTFAFQFSKSFLMPAPTCSHSVTHSANGHTLASGHLHQMHVFKPRTSRATPPHSQPLLMQLHPQTTRTGRPK